MRLSLRLLTKLEMVTISGSLLLPPSFTVKHAGNGLYREKIASEILSASRFDSLTILLEGLDGSDLNFCSNFYSFLNWKRGPPQLTALYVALNKK